MRVRVDYEAVLDFLLWGLEVFSRRDCGLILAGLRVCDSERRANQLLDRLHRRRFIERRGKGAAAKFRITAEGRQRAGLISPAREWGTPWDGKWRAFVYDLPETRSKDRVLLWRALRQRKFGLLQRSVWVWPREAEPLLMEIVNAQGIPECFCGLETGRLFLCSDAEVVATAWDWEEIGRRHETYIKHGIANSRSVRSVPNLNNLAHVARVEFDAYRYAFSMDPLLPRELWPKHYAGQAVEERHQRFRTALRRRLQELAG
jgi:DNA-binding transcriptional regulator PaaX